MSNIKLSWYALKVSDAKKTADKINRAISFLIENDPLLPYIKSCAILEKKKISYNKKNEPKETLINSFPPYIFIQAYLEDNMIKRSVIEFICKTISSPRLNIIGGYIDPRKISDLEFEKMSSSLKDQEEKNNYTNLKEGLTIKINNGPFKSMNGTILIINHDKRSIIAEIKIFGSSTEIELKFEEFIVE
jgi:transcription antitermination factor NusG